MSTKFDIFDKVYIPGEVIALKKEEASNDVVNTSYKVKFNANSSTYELWFDQDGLESTPEVNDAPNECCSDLIGKVILLPSSNALFIMGISPNENRFRALYYSNSRRVYDVVSMDMDNIIDHGVVNVVNDFNDILIYLKDHGFGLL